MKQNWLYDQIENSTYLGWKGLGPLFGINYYISIKKDHTIVIAKSLFKGIELYKLSNSAIICKKAEDPSLFYFLVATIVGYFYSDLFMDIKRVMEDSSPKDFIETILTVERLNILMLLFFYSVTSGLIQHWLFKRPKILLCLEGRLFIEIYTDFRERIPKTLKEISSARGLLPSESMRAKHSYYKYQTRSL